MNRALTLVALLALAGRAEQLAAQDSPPWGPSKPLNLVSSSVPQGGDMQILFHGSAGPFRIQKRDSVDPAAPWYDMVGARFATDPPR